MRTTFTDQELKTLLADTESVVAERKASFFREVATRACHMAGNGNPPPEFRVSASSAECVVKNA